MDFPWVSSVAAAMAPAAVATTSAIAADTAVGTTYVTKIRSGPGVVMGT